MNVLSLFDGRYEVRSDGKIFSNVRKSKNEMIGKVGDNGYRTVLLTVNNKRKYLLVHRVVAESFIPNPSNKRTVNHKDGDKLNNSAENLEWATDSENLKHARDTGLSFLKLTPTQANDIKSSNESSRTLSTKYGVSKTLINDIKRGARWA
jgi:hypothetical protein